MGYAPEIRNNPPKNGILHNITFTSFNPTSIQPQQQTATAENLQEQEKVSLPEIKQNDVVVDDNINIVAVDLPKTIEPNQQAPCFKALQGLTPNQQQRVIDVYRIKEKSEIIYNPVGLFIVLAKAERNGNLIVLKHANTMLHASHKLFVSDKEKSNKEGEKNGENKNLPDHFGRLTWLKETAEREGKPFLEFANLMQMQAYIEDLKILLIWLKHHAKKANEALDVLAESLSLSWVLPSLTGEYVSRRELRSKEI